MFKTGRITKESFYEEIAAFVKLSDQFGDQWKVEEIQYAGRLEQYLRKVTAMFISEPEEFSGCDVEEIEQSDSQEVLVKIKEQWKVEYHVVYSESYSVPVLYVNAHHADGSMVHHDELMKLCSSMHKDTITNHLWSTLSQTEHPFIGVPFYMLHPCNTSKLMSSARPEQSKRSYLIQWLSSIGPAVGLNIPSFYCN